jgi:hypothetical protein
MAFKAIDIDNGGTTTGYDPTLTVPASALQGDRMTVVVSTSDNSPDITPTPPATETWTLEDAGSMPVDGTGAASPPAVWVYGKDVSADDEANAGTKTYTWTFSGSEEQCGILILTDPAEFGEFAKDETSGNSTSRDAPSVTTTVNDELVYHCAIKDNDAAFTVIPSGITRWSEGFGPASDAGANMAGVEETYASPGPTGAKTYELPNNEVNTFTFSLRPLGVAAPKQTHQMMI